MNIFFLKQVNLPNMWYMPMILGMYLAIPFIAQIVKQFTLETIKLPIIIVFITTITLPSWNLLLKILNLEQYKIILDLSFLGGAYGVYILVGYYISKGLLKRYSNFFLVMGAVFSFTVTCIFQYITYKLAKGYNVWYDFITLFICSICIFELLIRIKNRENTNILAKSTKYISNISLGIFFMHEIFLNILVKYTEKLNINNPLESAILFVFSTACSVVFINLTSKVKFIKEKVFLIKD